LRFNELENTAPNLEESCFPPLHLNIQFMFCDLQNLGNKGS